MFHQSSHNPLKTRANRRVSCILAGVILGSAILAGTVAVSAQSADTQNASSNIVVAAVQNAKILRPTLPGSTSEKQRRNVRVIPIFKTSGDQLSFRR